MIRGFPSTVDAMNLEGRIFLIEMEALLGGAIAQCKNRWMLQNNQGVRVILASACQPFPSRDNGLLPSLGLRERDYLLMQIKAVAPVSMQVASSS
jgi:hypothetical protein